MANKHLVYVTVVGIAASLLWLGCSDESESPISCEQTLPNGSCVGLTQEEICTGTFCTGEASCQSTLYVKQGAGGNGSESNPFGTLAEAAGKAAAGDCIAVAAGSYAGAALKGGVSVLGCGAKHVTISADASMPGLSIDGGKGGLLRGFSISGDGLGMVVRKVDGLRVEQVRLASLRGVAIDAREVQQLTLRHVHVKTVALEGAPAADAGPDSSSPDSGTPDAGVPDAGAMEASPGPDATQPDATGPEPDAGTDAATDGGGDAGTSGSTEYGIGILVAAGSTAELERVVVEGAGTQGVLVHGSSAQVVDSVVTESGLFGVAFDCSGTCSGPGSEITGCQISDNKGLGLVVLGGKITAKNNTIGLTTYKAGFARNVQLQYGAEIFLEGNTVHGSKAQGIVIDKCTGTLLKNQVQGNEERGVVLQHVNSLTLEDNDLDGNERSGITTLSCKAVTIKNGRVANTKKRAVIVDSKSGQVGDGVQVLAESVVSITGLKVEGNSRVGVLIDNAKATVKDTSITGGEEALAVQNAKLADQQISNVTDASGQGINAVDSANPYITNPTELVGTLPLPLP